MHKTLSLGCTRAETKDCIKKFFLIFAAKNGGYTPGVIHRGGYASFTYIDCMYIVCIILKQGSKQGWTAWSARRLVGPLLSSLPYVLKGKKFNVLREISALLLSTVFCTKDPTINLANFNGCLDGSSWSWWKETSRKLPRENSVPVFRWRDFQLFSRLIDSSTQWIQCKDQCKGFSAIHLILSDWTQSMQGWILGIHSMAHRCLSVCVGTWLDSADSLLRSSADGFWWFTQWIPCKRSMQGFSVKVISDLTHGQKTRWLTLTVRSALNYYNLNLSAYFYTGGKPRLSIHRHRFFPGFHSYYPMLLPFGCWLVGCVCLVGWWLRGWGLDSFWVKVNCFISYHIIYTWGTEGNRTYLDTRAGVDTSRD